MDRRTVYPLQLPRETDLLAPQQMAMTALGKLAEAALGTQTVAKGFTLTQTSPASLNLVLSPGQIYQVAQLEASSWSSLSQDTHNIVKQGVLLDPTTLTFTPPGTVGYAVNVLVQAQYADVDGDAVVLPFYNAANPSQPYSGPGNNGQASSTTRKGSVSVLTKVGTAANAGSQTTPTADAGYVPLFVVTVPYGATALTAGNIIVAPLAPLIVTDVFRVPGAVQRNEFIACSDTSATPNTVIVTTTPPFASYSQNLELLVTFNTVNTGATQINVNGVGLVSLTRRDGSALLPGDTFVGLQARISFDGTKFRFAGLAQSEVPRNVANPTLWVRTDGSDTNNGLTNSAGGAFATIAAAIAYGAQDLATAGLGLTIALGIAGTYALTSVRPSLPITIIGDVANQGSYILQSSTGFGMGGSSGLDLKGLTLQNTGSTANVLATNGNVNVSLTNVTLTSTVTTSASIINAGPGTTVNIGAGCIFNGSAGYMLSAAGGTINMSAGVTVNGTPAFTYTLYSAYCGQLFVFPAATFTGGATSGTTKYRAEVNGVIVTYGSGVVIPGGTSGSVDTNGGRFV